MNITLWLARPITDAFFACRTIAAVLLAWLVLTVSGCSDRDEAHAAYPGEVSGYNYTSYPIGDFRIRNDVQPLSASGPNVSAKKPGRERGGGGAYVCCIGIPAHWYPDMQLVVTWSVDKLLDGNTPRKFYTATTSVAPYGKDTYGAVVHFLPGDRIRLQIVDRRGVFPRIADDDPYIAQGVLDAELNKRVESE